MPFVPPTGRPEFKFRPSDYQRRRQSVCSLHSPVHGVLLGHTHCLKLLPDGTWRQWWNNECGGRDIGGKILKTENRSAWRKACPSITLSTKNPTRTDLCLDPYLGGEKSTELRTAPSHFISFSTQWSFFRSMQYNLRTDRVVKEITDYLSYHACRFTHWWLIYSFSVYIMTSFQHKYINVR